MKKKIYIGTRNNRDGTLWFKGISILNFSANFLPRKFLSLLAVLLSNHRNLFLTPTPRQLTIQELLSGSLLKSKIFPWLSSSQEERSLSLFITKDNNNRKEYFNGNIPYCELCTSHHFSDEYCTLCVQSQGPWNKQKRWNEHLNAGFRIRMFLPCPAGVYILASQKNFSPPPPTPLKLFPVFVDFLRHLSSIRVF